MISYKLKKTLTSLSHFSLSYFFLFLLSYFLLFLLTHFLIFLLPPTSFLHTSETPSCSNCRRHGRWTQLRECRRSPCRNINRRYDSRFLPVRERIPDNRLKQNNQFRQRRKPRRLRHQLKTPRHNRMGINENKIEIIFFYYNLSFQQKSKIRRGELESSVLPS